MSCHPSYAVGADPINRRTRMTQIEQKLKLLSLRIGLGTRLIQEGARTALSARCFGEMIELRGHGCQRSVREILESAVGLGMGRRGLRSASQRRGWAAALTLILGAGLWAECSSEAAEINPPLGPYVHLTEADFADSSSFSTNTPLIATSYFYWYDIYSNAHILDGDGTDALTDHPPTLTDFSYKSKAWHQSQLSDMIEAGIDILLPVYWGAPSERNPTSS